MKHLKNIPDLGTEKVSKMLPIIEEIAAEAKLNTKRVRDYKEACNLYPLLVTIADQNGLNFKRRYNNSKVSGIQKCFQILKRSLVCN